MRQFLMRILALLTAERAERELAREIEAHLAMLRRDYEARGMSPTEAGFAARRAFGGVEQAKSRHRQVRSLPLVENLMWDMRLTVRALVRSRGFSGVAIVLMAVGVAVTTTLFSLTYGVLLKPLPWADPDRVVRLQETRGGKPGVVPWTITNTTYHAWREEPGTIEAIGGWTRARLVNLTIGSATPERLRVASITPGLFRTLRVPPVAGRFFSDEDVNRGVDTIVLGFHVWQRRFGGRADLVGQTLRLDDRIVTVVGIMPAHFGVPDRDTEAWIPLRVPRVDPHAASISGMIFNVVARLRPGATPEQAAAEATARGRAAPNLHQAGVALFGSAGDIRVSVVPARDAMTAEVRPALLMLLVGVGLLFATAVASVVVLQSSRAVRRRRDIAVRSAVGATNTRIAFVWLLESLALGTVGGIAGIALSMMLHRVIPLVVPSDFPRLDDIALDVRVALFAASLTLVASLVCGLVPAMQSRKKNLQAALSSDSVALGGGDARLHGGYLRAAMIVAQVAIACLLLVGTSLLGRSFSALLAADRGFDPRSVITTYATRPARPISADAASLERAQDRIRALPGVTHVAIANALPFVTVGGIQGLSLPAPYDPAATIQAQTLLRVVSPEYFAAMRLRVLAGRTLDRGDTSTSRPVVVVNRTFAAEYLGATTVGAVLPTVIGSRDKWEVVGVVEDMRQGGLRGIAPSRFGGVTDPPQPEMFFTYRQWDWDVSEIAYVVRGVGELGTMAPTLRATISEENPSLTIETVATMEDLLSNSLARPWTYAVLVASFALFATVVAIVGLFGVLSYVAEQRRREIGVRTALGAGPRDILRLVAREAVRMTLCGLVVGLSAAFTLASGLTTMLYEVNAHDVLTFVTVPSVVILAATAACCVPAYRASRVSPAVALRSH